MKRAVLIAAVAALCVAGSAVAEDRGGLIGSGTRTEDCGQVLGSGGAAPCQTMGSGGFTSSTQDQYMGSGGRAVENDQWMGNGGRAGDGGQTVGSGGATIQDGGYLGSGLSVRELRLFDGSSVLVVSSDKGTFVIPIE